MVLARTGAQPTFVVTVRGAVTDKSAAYAEEKVRHVASCANQPVLSAHVVLTLAADPARERPALAEATLDVNGFAVRAQATASDMLGAVDLLEDRLQRNLVHHQERVRTRHRWIGDNTDREWRHGELPTQRGAQFPRPPENREVVRRKTFALEPVTPDEAAFDMDVLGHDFYLFTDLDSGNDAVIYRRDDGGYGVRGDVTPAGEGATPVELEGSAPVLSEAEAATRLDLAGEPFVFYLDRQTGRGRVLYLRYDGHYGLITAK